MFGEVACRSLLYSCTYMRTTTDEFYHMDSGGEGGDADAATRPNPTRVLFENLGPESPDPPNCEHNFPINAD
jgi:hypothetical protein